MSTTRSSIEIYISSYDYGSVVAGTNNYIRCPSDYNVIENNVKEVRFSTLQKIVELGLGGKLELAIKL